jgi:hypothetical protein
MPNYKGGCHCGAFRLTVCRDAPIDRLIDCNCSICSKKGVLHLPVQENELTIDQSPGGRGESSLTQYQWGTNTAKHWFCPTCGIHVLNRPRNAPERYSVNARCLDDFGTILTSVTIVPFDGQDHPKDRS